MLTIVKGSQRDPTAFRSGIVYSRLSRQGGLCKSFTGAVAHKALPPYLTTYMEMGMGIGTTEWQVQKQTRTLLMETSRITPPHVSFTPHFT
jgi:hypothetical protein